MLMKILRRNFFSPQQYATNVRRMGVRLRP